MSKLTHKKVMETIDKAADSIKYYVTMTDKFMSGWGHSKGKINKLIFECADFEQAQIVAENAENRTDQKHINVSWGRKPYYNKGRYYPQYKTIKDYPSWYVKDYFKERKQANQ